MARVSTAIDFNEEHASKMLESVGMSKEGGESSKDVFFNGKFIGFSDNLPYKLRETQMFTKTQRLYKHTENRK